MMTPRKKIVDEPVDEPVEEVVQEEEAAEVPVLETMGETRVFDQVPFTQETE